MSEVANNSSAPVLTALNIFNAVNLEKIFACVNFDSTKINVKNSTFLLFLKYHLLVRVNQNSAFIQPAAVFLQTNVKHKSSHLYLYSTFNKFYNIKNRKIVY